MHHGIEGEIHINGAGGGILRAVIDGSIDHSAVSAFGNEHDAESH
jgi:hypothetical protein